MNDDTKAEKRPFLTDDERQRLALATDVTHDDCFETTTPGTCELDEVVKRIVRDRVATALTDAAERLIGTTSDLDPQHKTQLAYINCTRIDADHLVRMAKEARRG